jgi:pilus assembly protein CpaB
MVLAGLALLLGALAASDVAGREAALARRVGPLVSVVVAREDVAAGEKLTAARLGVRQVPARFAPRGAFASAADVAGLEARAALVAGADVTAASIDSGDARAPGAPVKRGERVAEVVATAAPEAIAPGVRVDVLVTREARGADAGRTQLALQDVEVLGARPAPADDRAAGERVSASLRVTVRQAVYLAAAQAFASDVRLLPRAAGDRGRAGAGLAVSDAL